MAKRRPSGDGMVRKRQGKWEGRIVVGHKADGAPIFRYVYAKTQKELLDKLHQKINIYQDAELTEDSNMTLGEWMDKWLDEYVEGTVRPSTICGYRGYSEHYIKPHLGNKKVSQLTSMDIQRLYTKLKKEGRVHEHPQYGYQLSDATICRVHTTLHSALKMAVQVHMIVSSPMDSVISPKPNYKPMQVLNEEQLDVFLAAVDRDEIWRDLFYIELTTGLRRGELCGLRWTDFDEKTGTLRIDRSLSSARNGEVVIGETKTNQGKRKITLPASTTQRLRERKKKAMTEWIFYNPICPEKPVNPAAAYLKMKQILKENDLPSIRFHDLRHTFATHAMSSGVDPKTLSGILGHTNASFTLDTYTHVTGEMQKQAASIVGDFMTDIFGEELKPWQENAKTAKEQ